MGGFDFEWEGKTYSAMTEGGYPFFDDEETKEAFDKWRKTPEGIDFFGPAPTDWSKEHYLDDRYPFDHERGCRVNAAELGKEGVEFDEDMTSIRTPRSRTLIGVNIRKVQVRYGCYQHFYLTGKAHVCSKCGVHSCKECARGSFKKCSSKGCDEMVCGKHSTCGEHNTSKRSRKK